MAEVLIPESSNEHTGGGPSQSTEQLAAEIRDTRRRLTAGLTRTADYVDALFTTPSSAQAEAPDGGFIDRAVRLIAVVGRIKRTWDDPERAGLLRRGAVAAGTIAIAVVLVARRRLR